MNFVSFDGTVYSIFGVLVLSAYFHDWSQYSSQSCCSPVSGTVQVKSGKDKLLENWLFKVILQFLKIFNSSLRYTYFCIDKTTYLIDLLTFLTPIIRRILLIQIISNTYFGKAVCLLNKSELSRFIFFSIYPLRCNHYELISFSSLICYFSKINWETCFY